MSAPADITSAATGAELTDAQWENDSWGDAPSDKPVADDGEELLARWDAEEAESDDDQDDGMLGDDEDSEEEAEERTAKRATSKQEKGKQKPETQKPGAKEKTAAKGNGDAEEHESPRSYKVKLDGEERELSADKIARALGVSESVLARLEPGSAEKLYQKLHLAETRTRKSTEAQQQLDTFLNRVKSPASRVAALRELLSHPQVGVDLKDLAHEALADEFAMSQMNEDQRELHRAKRELEGMRAREAARERERQAAEEADRRQRFAQQLNTEITEALEAEQLPAEPRIRARVISLMQRQRDAGETITSTTAKELMPKLREEIRADLRAFTKGMTGEQLEELFGPEISKAMGEARVAKFKKNSTAQTQARREERTEQVTRAPRRTRPAPVYLDDVLKDIGRGR